MTRCIACYIGCIVCFITSAARGAEWNAAGNRAVLRGKMIDATFQSGLLVELKSSAGGELIKIAPEKLPSTLPLFGPTSPINLDTCRVTQEVSKDSLTVTMNAPDGISWQLNWSFDAAGDLVLRSSANTPKPNRSVTGLTIPSARPIRYPFTNCRASLGDIVTMRAARRASPKLPHRPRRPPRRGFRPASPAATPCCAGILPATCT